MLGPFDFSVNEELGMLVDGFKTPPFVMMGHHRDYYPALLDHVGLDKEIDLFAYYLDISRPYTDRIARIVRHASRDSRIKLHLIARSEREQGLRRAHRSSCLEVGDPVTAEMQHAAVTDQRDARARDVVQPELRGQDPV